MTDTQKEEMPTYECHIKDQGHLNLINDLDALVLEAIRGEFHDFANQKYAMPKVELSNRLHQIRMNVIEGKYDNEPKPNVTQELNKQ